MAVRSGVAAQCMISTETTWGTYQAVVTGIPFTSESLRRNNAFIRTAGLRAGRLAQSADLHTATTHDASGGLSTDVLTKSFGKFFNLMHGNTVTPTQIAATTAYRQTHAIGATDPFNKSLTIQVGRPDVGGTVRPFNYLGAKLMSVTFNMERGGVLTSEWEFDCKDEDTSTALVTATYAASSLPFSFQSGSIELDDSVLTDCVRSASLGVEFPHDTERYCINSSALKSQPILNGLIAVTADLEVEFASLTQHTAFVNSTRRKLELRNNQGDAGGSNPFACNFTLASTVATGEGTVVEGPDVLTSTWSFEGLDNGTDPVLSLEYVTQDTAL
jgi:hypothetical protein